MSTLGGDRMNWYSRGKLYTTKPILELLSTWCHCFRHVIVSECVCFSTQSHVSLCLSIWICVHLSFSGKRGAILGVSGSLFDLSGCRPWLSHLCSDCRRRDSALRESCVLVWTRRRADLRGSPGCMHGERCHCHLVLNDNNNVIITVFLGWLWLKR